MNLYRCFNETICENHIYGLVSPEDRVTDPGARCSVCEEEGNPALAPFSSFVVDGIRYETFAIDIPDDVYPSVQERAECAINQVWEACTVYRSPCQWEAWRLYPGWEETYLVRRLSRA